MPPWHHWPPTQTFDAAGVMIKLATSRIFGLVFGLAMTAGLPLPVIAQSVATIQVSARVIAVDQGRQAQSIAFAAAQKAVVGRTASALASRPVADQIIDGFAVRTQSGAFTVDPKDPALVRPRLNQVENRDVSERVVRVTVASIGT